MKSLTPKASLLICLHLVQHIVLEGWVKKLSTAVLIQVKQNINRFRSLSYLPFYRLLQLLLSGFDKSTAFLHANDWFAIVPVDMFKQ